MSAKRHGPMVLKFKRKENQFAPPPFLFFSFFSRRRKKKKKVCHHLSEKFQSWRYFSPVGGFMRPRFSSQVVHRHQSSISSPLCLIFHLSVTLLACPSSSPPPPQKTGLHDRFCPGGVGSEESQVAADENSGFWCRRLFVNWGVGGNAAELYQHEAKAANVWFFWSQAMYSCT